MIVNNRSGKGIWNHQKCEYVDLDKLFGDWDEQETDPMKLENQAANETRLPSEIFSKFVSI